MRVKLFKAKDLRYLEESINDWTQQAKISEGVDIKDIHIIGNQVRGNDYSKHIQYLAIIKYI